MNDPREMLYDTRWQFLRIKLKAGWSKRRTAHLNLAKLQAYLDLSETQQELYIRLYRVTNLLAVIPQAKGDLLQNPVALEIAMFREPLVALLKAIEPKHPLESLPSWDADLQYRMLQHLRSMNPVGFQQLLADVSGREVKLPHNEKDLLVKYLSLMRKVSNETLI